MYQKKKPPRSYDTILKLLKFIKARVNTIVLDDNYTHDIQQEFLQTPKIAKPIIKGMSNATKTKYHDKETDIDFPHIVNGFI